MTISNTLDDLDFDCKYMVTAGQGLKYVWWILFLGSVTKRQSLYKHSKSLLPAISLISSMEFKPLSTFVKSPPRSDGHQVAVLMKQLIEILDTLHNMGLHHGQLSHRHVCVQTAHSNVSNNQSTKRYKHCTTWAYTMDTYLTNMCVYRLHIAM